MKENNDKKRERKSVKDKKMLFSAALACAALILAIVFVVSFTSGGNEPSIDAGNVDTGVNGGVENPDDGVQEEPLEPTGMVLPMQATELSGYGFHYNQTLDAYFHHDGVDFLAAAGTEVLAAETGTVESIFTGDVLSGTEIVVDHGNGLKTLYRFVEPVDGIQVGDEVKKGDVIATVAEATGDEYKDGAHLHFEITENGQTVDPTEHLTLEEK
ncbi:MAG: M23 family metallopeptidase [Clostridia bacterium]|nr:M23 family metallopeptidase [Clostridia bacterium]